MSLIKTLTIDRKVLRSNLVFTGICRVMHRVTESQNLELDLTWEHKLMFKCGVRGAQSTTVHGLPCKMQPTLRVKGSPRMK